MDGSCSIPRYRGTVYYSSMPSTTTQTRRRTTTSTTTAHHDLPLHHRRPLTTRYYHSAWLAQQPPEDAARGLRIYWSGVSGKGQPEISSARGVRYPRGLEGGRCGRARACVRRGVEVIDNAAFSRSGIRMSSEDRSRGGPARRRIIATNLGTRRGALVWAAAGGALGLSYHLFLIGVFADTILQY